MGWLSKMLKPVAKLVDPLLPESVKKAANNSNGMFGAAGAILSGDQSGKGGGAAAPAAAASVDNTGRLTQEEIDANLENAKKLARLGKYFTSPLGALSTANTAGQKVFS